MKTEPDRRRRACTAPLMALLALAALPAWAAAPAASPTTTLLPAPAASAAHGMVPMRKRPPPPPAHLVDLNSASRAELKTLPGIGDAEAAKIVANRPYLTKTELVTKRVLPAGPYASLKRLVVAMPPKKAGKPPRVASGPAGSHP